MTRIGKWKSIILNVDDFFGASRSAVAGKPQTTTYGFVRCDDQRSYIADRLTFPPISSSVHLKTFKKASETHEFDFQFIMTSLSITQEVEKQFKIQYLREFAVLAPVRLIARTSCFLIAFIFVGTNGSSFYFCSMELKLKKLNCLHFCVVSASYPKLLSYPF